MWLDSKRLMHTFDVYAARTAAGNEPVGEQRAGEALLASLLPQVNRLRAPLQNKPKNASARITVRRVGEEIQLGQNGAEVRVKLDQQLSDDALALSDLFELDEADALDLVLSGELQQQQSRLRGLSRLQCAVVCYYEAHRHQLQLLKSLLMMTHGGGNNGGNGTESAVGAQIRDLTLREFLANKHFFGCLFDRSAAFSTESEMKRLGACTQTAQFGAPFHQEMLHTTMAEIRLAAYDVLCMSVLYCPVPFQQELQLRLFAALQQLSPEAVLSQSELTTLTTLLLFINPARLRLQCDGSTELFAQFAQSLSTGRWAHRCLRAVVQLCFGVAIKYARNSLGLAVPHELNEYALVEEGIDGMAIEFLHAYVVKFPDLGQLSFTIDVLDSLLKNFICYFREKIAEMYNLCECELFSLLEAQQQHDHPSSTSTFSSSTAFPNHQAATAHIKMSSMFFDDESEEKKPLAEKEAVQAPSLNPDYMHFRALLELITSLYDCSDDCPKLAASARDFTSSKVLCEFVGACRRVTAPPLAIAYLNLLRALCNSGESAHAFFGLLLKR